MQTLLLEKILPFHSNLFTGNDNPFTGNDHLFTVTLSQETITLSQGVNPRGNNNPFTGGEPPLNFRPQGNRPPENFRPHSCSRRVLHGQNTDSPILGDVPPKI